VTAETTTGLERVQRLDVTLMQCYEQLLAVAAWTQDPARPYAKHERRPLGSRASLPLVRLLLRRHVRARMGELAAAYQQRAAVAASTADAEWYERSADRCASVEASIPVYRLPAIAVIVSALTVAPKLLRDIGVIDLGNRELTAAYVVQLGYFATAVCLVYLRPAFVAKRRLLLGTVTPGRSLDPPDRNVYEAEEQLFDAICRRKRPELVLDRTADVTAMIAVVLILVLLPQAAPFDATPWYWGAVVGVFAVLYAIVELRAKRPRDEAWR